MLIRNHANGWVVEGMPLITLAAYRDVSDAEMLAYYKLDPIHPDYAELRRAREFDRIVLMKADGTFVVVPINEHVEVYE